MIHDSSKDCPVCIAEKRPVPLPIHRAGVCRTHYTHQLNRQHAAQWDGKTAIRRAADFHVWPMKYQQYPHQLEWLDLYQDNAWILLLAPCDHGKTITCVVSYACFRIAENPDIRIVIAGANAELSKITLGAIKAHIERNTDYIKYFERIHGYVPKPESPRNWTKNSVTISRPSDDDAIKDPTVVAIGKGGELENRRIDIFMGDDLITKRAAESEVERKADLSWFLDVVMTRGEEDCEVKLDGTPEQPDDLYETIATGETETGEKYNQFFHIVRVRALAPIGESHYYTDTDNIVTESEYPGDQLHPLCEFMMSRDGLLRRARLSQGTFIRKYQCRHSATSDRMFPVGKLNACKDPQLVVPGHYDAYDRPFRMTLMGVDIATGQAVSFFAMALLGIDMEFRHVVLNLYREKVRFVEQLIAIMKWFRAYMPSYVGVESNGQQQSIIDAYRNVRTVDGVDLSDIKRVKFEPVFTQQSMLMATTTSLSALIDNGGLVIPDGDLKTRATMEPLVKEMKSYPSSQMKDCLRALQIAEELYSMKATYKANTGTFTGVPQVRGAYKERIVGARRSRYRNRRDVKQPQPLDAFNLPKGGGVRTSLIDFARHSRT